MLWVGLSGGIGSGKSTVARRLAEHGAVLVDADVLAREVVEPGSEGLAELVELFGEGILDAEGRMDRPAVAQRVFADEQARAQLNSVVHPRIAALTAERVAEAPQDAVVVHDIPLLVEAGYAPDYHLVLIVDADEDTRVQRLVGRGLEESDARARIRAQASRQQRVEAADVWLDNSGEVGALTARVDGVWERLASFEANLRGRRAADADQGAVVEHDPDWSHQAARLSARLRKAAGDRALSVDHVGPTAVPGLPARDVLDLQITVASPEDADALAEPLGNAGFPAVPGIRSEGPDTDGSDTGGSDTGGSDTGGSDTGGSDSDGPDRDGPGANDLEADEPDANGPDAGDPGAGDPDAGDPGAAAPDSAAPGSGDPSQWEKRLHATADPGRPASVHLRVAGRENWRRAFLVRDWLTADAAARELHAGASSWLRAPRAERWAAESGWSAPEL